MSNPSKATFQNGQGTELTSVDNIYIGNAATFIANNVPTANTGVVGQIYANPSTGALFIVL